MNGQQTIILIKINSFLLSLVLWIRTMHWKERLFLNHFYCFDQLFQLHAIHHIQHHWSNNIELLSLFIERISHEFVYHLVVLAFAYSNIDCTSKMSLIILVFFLLRKMITSRGWNGDFWITLNDKSQKHCIFFFLLNITNWHCIAWFWWYDKTNSHSPNHTRSLSNLTFAKQ